MASPSITSSIIRFGLFEVDLHARELRKSGIRVKIQDQPFQILSVLLEHPGEVVTREDLQKRLWSADTFVDFDLSLNSAIKKLRVALNDDSDNPRFIETLYRRGYRFIGPVIGGLNGNGTAATESDPAGLRIVPPLADSMVTIPATTRSRRQLFFIAAGVLALVAAAGAIW